MYGRMTLLLQTKTQLTPHAQTRPAVKASLRITAQGRILSRSIRPLKRQTGIWLWIPVGMWRDSHELIQHSQATGITSFFFFVRAQATTVQRRIWLCATLGTSQIPSSPF
jgi:hypothetical protein